MSYRDTAESLRARRDHVSAQLAQARLAAREAQERAGQVATLEKELAEVNGLLQSGGWKKSLPVLETLQIASPCSANWDEMAGDDRVRFCGQCAKNVYNLSAMPRDEAEAFLVANEGQVCVRLYKRADGTVINADCPVGVQRKRRRRAAVAAVGGSLLAAAASTLTTSRLAMTQGEPMPTMALDEGRIAPHLVESFGPSSVPPSVRPPEPVVPLMGALPPMVQPPTAPTGTGAMLQGKVRPPTADMGRRLVETR